jgi:hypothetical protein
LPDTPPEIDGQVYVPEDDRGEAADADLPGDLAFVADPDWDAHPRPSDVPWEVTCESSGDWFDASF